VDFFLVPVSQVPDPVPGCDRVRHLVPTFLVGGTPD
jgi:hypothetical protein